MEYKHSEVVESYERDLSELDKHMAVHVEAGFLLAGYSVIQMPEYGVVHHFVWQRERREG